MAEYIDRQAAIDAIDESLKRVFVLPVGKSIMDKIPAADVMPVVLCRNCKYTPIGDKDGSDLEWPFNEFDENPCPYKCLDNWYSRNPAPDFFCAAGEKREES